MRTPIVAVLLAVFAALSAVGFAPAASAETVVRWSISSENWVESTTAEAFVTISTTAKTMKGASTAAYDAVEALRKITSSEWRVIGRNVAVNRKDQFGMANWSMDARTRISIETLDGLSSEITRMNRPGTGITISRIDMSPSLIEVERGQAKLRKAIIAQAKTEATDIAATVNTIDFIPGVMTPPRPNKMIRNNRAQTMELMSPQVPRTGAVRIELNAAVEAVMR